jgi:hypothetical protein
MEQSAVRAVGSHLPGIWLQGLFAQYRSASIRLMSRLVNSKATRCFVLRECTEESHYKGGTIETTVFSEGPWRWHAQTIVCPSLDNKGEGYYMTTESLSAYDEREALALASEGIREIIDSH